MEKRKGYPAGIAAGIAMFMLILDTKTAVGGAKEAISLCFQTIIPSLFPFFILSGIINSYILGTRSPVLRPLGRLCKIPRGCESLLLLGLIAGYPVGAQLIAKSCKDGALTRKNAGRLLGFCNNAGPAFLFGMLSPLFDNPIAPWLLWAVHITAAIIIGCILPIEESNQCDIRRATPVTLSQSLQSAIKTMATVCGWVTAFRIVIAFCERWFLWRFPNVFRVLFTGMLELSNGCVMLKDIPNEGVRFLLAGILLAGGGLCVGMQTKSVTEGVGTGLYFPGKLLHICLSAIMILPLLPIMFPDGGFASLPLTIIGVSLFTGALLLVILRGKKVVAINRRMMYNTGS